MNKATVIGIGCVVGGGCIGRIGGVIGDRLALNVAGRESYELGKGLYEDVELEREENLTYSSISERVSKACNVTARMSSRIGFCVGVFSLLVGNIIGEKVFPKLMERL